MLEATLYLSRIQNSEFVTQYNTFLGIGYPHQQIECTIYEFRTFSLQNRELVRQKAVLCLHRFQLLAPDLLAHVQPDLEQMLFDKDPGVMAASLNIVSHNIQVNHYYPYTIFISITKTCPYDIQ